MKIDWNNPEDRMRAISEWDCEYCRGVQCVSENELADPQVELGNCVASLPYCGIPISLKILDAIDLPAGCGKPQIAIGFQEIDDFSPLFGFEIEYCPKCGRRLSRE